MNYDNIFRELIENMAGVGNDLYLWDEVRALTPDELETEVTDFLFDLNQSGLVGIGFDKGRLCVMYVDFKQDDATYSELSVRASNDRQDWWKHITEASCHVIPDDLVVRMLPYMLDLGVGADALRAKLVNECDFGDSFVAQEAGK